MIEEGFYLAADRGRRMYLRLIYVFLDEKTPKPLRRFYYIESELVLLLYILRRFSKTLDRYMHGIDP